MKKISLTLASAALAAASLPLGSGCSNGSPAEQAQAPAGHPAVSQSATQKLRPVLIPPSLRTIAFDDHLFAPPPVPEYSVKSETQRVAEHAARRRVADSGERSQLENSHAKSFVAVTPLPPLTIPESNPAELQGSTFDYRADLTRTGVPSTPSHRIKRLPPVESFTLPDADELSFAPPANAPQRSTMQVPTPARPQPPREPLATPSPTPAKAPSVERSVLRRIPAPSQLTEPTLANTRDWGSQAAVKVNPPATEPTAPAYTQGIAPAPQRLAPELSASPQAPQLPTVIVQPLNLPIGGNVQMDVVQHHSRMLIQRGTELGERGALYSAKTDFQHALRLIAQAQDASAGNRRHSDALERAWQTLEEAEDFTPSGSRSVDLAQVVAAHRTQILKHTDLTRLTPLEASQQYFSYAQQQLAIAGGNEPVAAEALHCLGKTHVFIARESNESARTHGPMALAMQQAALMVDDHHDGAANELGVLLAKYGQWTDARRVLLHGISIHPTAEKWENLAVVHEHLGETPLAQMAKQEAELATMQLAQQDMPSKNRVRWVNPDAFAQNGRVNTNLPTTQQQPQAAPAPQTPAAGNSSTAWKWPWVK